MKLTNTITALSALTLFAAAAPLQEALKPVDSPWTPQAGGAVTEADSWVAALRGADLKQRMKTYEALVQRGASEESVRRTIQTWAEDPMGGELAWTAQLLLREIERQPRTSLRTRPFGSSFWGRQDPFDMSELESLFEELQSKDPFAAFRRSSPFGLGMRLPQGSLQPLGPGMEFESNSFGLEMGPDGIKLKLEETVDGKTETKTYEAESMEALLEAHPELEERIGARGLTPERLLPSPRGGSLVPAPLDQKFEPSGAQALKPLRPSLDQLGIRMLPPAERQKSFEGVSEDVGLEVVGVLPGSLADLVGVEVGDLVIAIAGQTIRSAADVRGALDGVSLDERIEVICVRSDGERRVRAWVPKNDSNQDRRF